MEMKKEKSNSTKISRDDRIQALIRSKQFLEDLRNTIFSFPDKPNKKVFSSKRIKTFEEKYKVIIPNPQDFQSFDHCIEMIKWEVLNLGFENDFAARAIPDKDSKYEYNKDPFVRDIRDSRFLHVEIDLTKEITEITKKIKSLIKQYEKYVNKPKGRSEKTKYDIWQIYDMKHKEGYKPLQIAKNLSGEDGNLSYNPELTKAYAAVKRALDKTERIMKQIRKTVF